MLRLTIPKIIGWDEDKEEFVEIEKEQTIVLEHSLVSISKWESKWHKPFLHTSLTTEEIIDYVKCMTITQNVKSTVYNRLGSDQIKQITDYINDPMTATWFSDKGNGGRSRQIITSELIYYWMISLNIPVNFEKWHLNRLLTLIRVCNEENAPKDKKNKQLSAKSRRLENEARKKRWNTKG